MAYRKNGEFYEIKGFYMEVFLIRHTKTAVIPGTCYGNSDVDVADSFPEEAEKVRVKLKGERFDAVYSSPLQRCRKLAVYCGYENPILDDRLKELNFGSWEGQRWDEIRDPCLQEWYDDWLSIPAGGAESFLEQYNRVSAFLDDLKKTEYGKVCVFAHGGTIRAALIYAGKYNFNQAFTDDVDYGSLVKMTI